LSVAGTSFTSVHPDNTYEYVSWGGVNLTGHAGWHHMTAPVQLPQGAIIQSVTLYYDESDTFNDINLRLYQYDAEGGSRTLALASSAGGGIGSVSDTSIISPTVDNWNYSYALVAFWETTDLVLYGARIEYSPSGPTPRRASGVSAPAFLSGESDPTALTDVQAGEGSPALHTGGEVTLFTPALQTDPVAELEVSAGSASGSAVGSRLLGGGGPSSFWEAYKIAGATMHPADSAWSHEHTGGGGRWFTGTATLPTLVAPLDLIDDRTIRRVRCIYYDNTTHNPRLLLYQVDRQGSGVLQWDFTPAASGGYFEATSPPMGLPVNNEDFAYYVILRLGDTVVESDLIVYDLEVLYVDEVFLPLVLRTDDNGLVR
jgi:hypothetical protein